MNAVTGGAGIHTGSAAVTNLLRLVRTDAEGVAAFAAVAGEDGSTRIFAVPPPGAPGALDAPTLEDLARQISADPELPHARVVVRAVNQEEPFTVAAASMPGGSGVVAVVRAPDHSVEDRHADAVERVAARLARHFDALRQLVPSRAGVGAAGNRRGAPQAPPVWPGPAEAGTPHVADAEAGTPHVADAGAGAPHVADAEAGATEVAAAEAEVSPPPFAPGEAGGPGETQGAQGTVPALWWSYPDAVTGLHSAARFCSRAGQLLQSPARESHAFALVLVEIPNEETAPAAATAITSQLRSTDPVARIDRDLFAVAVLVAPGSPRDEAVEDRLGGAVRGALEWLSPVRTTHVRAEPGDRRDVDELLRAAIAALPGRVTGSGGAPWRGAGGSAAWLPFP